MATIITGIVGTIIAIGTVVYEVGKAVYQYIVKPIQKVTDILEKVNKAIKDFTKLIQGKIDYVLDITGVTALVELTAGVKRFVKRAEVIMQGRFDKIVSTIADLYAAITDTASSIIHFTTSALEGVYTAQAKLEADIKYISEVRIETLTKEFENFGKTIEDMNRDLIRTINDEIQKESDLIKEILEGKIRIVEGDVAAIRYKIGDIDFFTEMFLRIMER